MEKGYSYGEDILNQTSLPACSLNSPKSLVLLHDVKYIRLSQDYFI